MILSSEKAFRNFGWVLWRSSWIMKWRSKCVVLHMFHFTVDSCVYAPHASSHRHSQWPMMSIRYAYGTYEKFSACRLLKTVLISNTLAILNSTKCRNAIACYGAHDKCFILYFNDECLVQKWRYNFYNNRTEHEPYSELTEWWSCGYLLKDIYIHCIHWRLLN